MKLLFKLLIFTLFISGCSNKFSKTPEENFIGIWKIEGRSMFNGIQIKIEKEDKEFIGRIFKLNDNKLVQLFADSNEIWVSGIERKSQKIFFLFTDFPHHKNLKLSFLIKMPLDWRLKTLSL